MIRFINHIEVSYPRARYGRNTTAGVINVITNKPRFGKLSARNDRYNAHNAINADASSTAQ
jgi:iron complex outermembrane receptor protein